MGVKRVIAELTPTAASNCYHGRHHSGEGIAGVMAVDSAHTLVKLASGSFQPHTSMDVACHFPNVLPFTSLASENLKVAPTSLTLPKCLVKVGQGAKRQSRS